ncbi:G-protein coupled receptor 65 [Microcaecilia unicolor]|uniref:Psychosine receptor n=1 Tax=Microcaecilia unicolor TaxID=1415580 RepID=A0A6P7Z4N9_9AMPH|nr:psychosine receptor [Microcaecilia unicolor]
MMNNSSNSCDVPHEQDGTFYSAIYIFVTVISIPANFVSLCVACLQVRKKNEIGIYLFNLSLADLLYTLTLPLWTYYIMAHNNWKLPATLCSISEFFKYTNFYTSAGFLTCICVDRYLAVVYPLRFSQLRTRKSAVKLSITVWAAAILSNIIILAYEQTRVDQSQHRLCYDIFPLEPWKASFNIVQTCVWHFVPLAIMALCYQRIYTSVRYNQATADREKKKIQKLLIGIMATFVFCFTPYHIVLLIRSTGEPGNCEFAQRISQPYKGTLALASLNCIADPVLYCFVSETGRNDILNCCAQQKKASQPQHEGFTMSPLTSDNTAPV